MSLRVDGGSSEVQKETPVYTKPAVKTNPVKTDDTKTNGAVLANQSANSQQATLLKTKLYAQFSPPVSNPAPPAPITTDEAKTQAEAIIATNGGKDHLNTDSAGQQLGEIAKQSPTNAKLIADQIYSNDRIKDEDRDEIAQSFARDFSDSELSQLAGTKDGQALLKNIETNLLDYPVHDDEAADASRIRTTLDQNGIFLGSDQGVYFDSVDPVSIQEDKNATPEQVASYVKNHPSSSYDQDTGRFAYIDALDAHKDDAAWLGKFYSAMGSKLSAQMISDTVTPSVQQTYGGNGTDPKYTMMQADLVRHSLETMQKGGVLTQDGMNALVNSMQKNPYVATDIFAKSDSTDLKTMFVNAAVNNGDKTWDAGALYTLNTMGSYEQEQVLNGLGDKLNPFIEGAMAGQQQMFSLSDSVKYGIYGTSANQDLLTKVNYGGIDKLLQTANHNTVYYYARTVVPDFSPELQTKLFNATSQALTNSDAFDNFKGDTNFKDNLSTLFTNNRDALLLEAQKGPDGQNAGHINDNFEKGLEKFFQIALLTPPNGKEYENLSGSLFQFINQGVTALSDPALANRDQGAFDNFRNKFGIEPTQYARLLGGVLGCVMDATGFSQEAINDDKAKKAETIKFFTGLAFAMIPGAGSSIGSTVSNEIFKHFVEKGVEYFQGQAQDNIQDKINDMLSGSFDNSDDDRASKLGDLVLGIFDDGLRSLPNGSSINGNAALEQFDFQGDFFDGFINTSQFTRLDSALGH